VNKVVEVDVQVTNLTYPIFQLECWYSLYPLSVASKSTGCNRIALAEFSTVSSILIEEQPYEVLYGTRYQRTHQRQLVIGNDGFPQVDPTPGVLGKSNPDWLANLENYLQWKGYNSPSY
jgi:hypothetical protein